ncbi:MAG TPA: GFA family protein, partial [Steroidobacteraceae bacterium]
EGELAEYASLADSGNRMRRRFCPRCGTSMLANSEARPQFTGVRVGTLDDPSRIKPEATIWTSAAPQWAVFDAALPHFEGQPPPPGAPGPR